MPSWKKVIVSGSDASLNSVTTSGDITANQNLKSLFSAGDEGGEIFLNKSVTNTTLTTGVTIDIYQNRLRIFEAGGTNRGGYFDISTLATGVGTNLSLVGQNLVSSSAFTSPSQGTVRATINGVQTDVDTGLQTGDAPSFTGLLLTGVPTNTSASRVFVSGSGGVVQTRVLNSELLSGYDIVTTLIPVEHRGQPTGFSPLAIISDLQPAQSPYGTWIAPYGGYIHTIQLMVGQTNTTTDDYTIQPYKNGSTISIPVTQALGATQYNVYDYSFGSGYSFSRGDKIEFELNKNTNTCDLYTLMITYKIQPFT